MPQVIVSIIFLWFNFHLEVHGHDGNKECKTLNKERKRAWKQVPQFQMSLEKGPFQ
jgi:hypothetical protein